MLKLKDRAQLQTVFFAIIIFVRVRGNKFGIHIKCDSNSSNSYLWSFPDFDSISISNSPPPHFLCNVKRWNFSANVYKFEESLHVICLLKSKQQIANETSVFTTLRHALTATQIAFGTFLQLPCNQLPLKVNVNMHEHEQYCHALRQIISVLCAECESPNG